VIDGSEEKAMTEHVCPWWMGYLIDNPLRRLIHNPEKILAPYVTAGTTAMGVGFRPSDQPHVFRCRSVVLVRP
jgi:hypothetical protein